MTSDRTIAIVIFLDTLHDNFDSIFTNLLEVKNKSINEIQSILQSKETKNISKQATGVVANVVILFRNNQGMKKKANSNEKCYNCHKFGHFGRNYQLLNRRLNKNTNQNKRRNAL